MPVSRWYGDVVRERLDLDPETVHPVHNGIDPADFGPWQGPEVPTIGYLARMHRPKGVHTLVEAFLLVKERVPNARLRLAGALGLLPGSLVVLQASEDMFEKYPLPFEKYPLLMTK